MFQDAQSIPTDSVLDSDLCIVGCGAAGITIARELAGSSLRVTVLESGGLDFDAPTSDLYVGDITGLPYFELQFARLRYFGGSTNHWGGTCRPEEPIDFEVRDWVPHSGWPISRADLDPYYPRAAEVVGLNVAERDLDVWRAASPFPTMPFDDERIVTVVAQIVKSRERRFAPRYRSELESAANINVVLHANATEIETNGAGGAVERIHAATLAGGRFTVTAGAYIVATGGIENARLLLASDRVRPNGVGNDHDLVGTLLPRAPSVRRGDDPPHGQADPDRLLPTPRRSGLDDPRLPEPERGGGPSRASRGCPGPSDADLRSCRPGRAGFEGGHEPARPRRTRSVALASTNSAKTSCASPATS